MVDGGSLQEELLLLSLLDPSTHTHTLSLPLTSSGRQTTGPYFDPRFPCLEFNLCFVYCVVIVIFLMG